MIAILCPGCLKPYRINKPGDACPNCQKPPVAVVFDQIKKRTDMMRCSECRRVLDPDDVELDDSGNPHCVGECPGEDPWDFKTGTWKKGYDPETGQSPLNFLGNNI